MGMPTGASSNMPIGGILYWVINPLTTRLVEVLIKVTELVRMEENDSGISSLDGLILARLARPMTIGTKNAVAAVLLTKALMLAAVTMTTRTKRVGSSPVCRRMARPVKSMTPVRRRAAVRIN